MRGMAPRPSAALLALVLACLPLLVAPECGKDVEPGRLGEPCTRSDGCAEGLRCLAGTCDHADGGTEPVSDAAADAPEAADAARDAPGPDS